MAVHSVTTEKKTIFSAQKRTVTLAKAPSLNEQGDISNIDLLLTHIACLFPHLYNNKINWILKK